MTRRDTKHQGELRREQVEPLPAISTVQQVLARRGDGALLVRTCPPPPANQINNKQCQTCTRYALSDMSPVLTAPASPGYVEAQST